jgi:flagellar biosynthesis GTPase FlhF
MSEFPWIDFFRSAKINEKSAEEYAKLFEAHDIEISMGGDLTHELLSEMGIRLVGHRIKILRYFASERYEYTGDSGSNPISLEKKEVKRKRKQEEKQEKEREKQEKQEKEKIEKEKERVEKEKEKIEKEKAEKEKAEEKEREKHEKHERQEKEKIEKEKEKEKERLEKEKAKAVGKYVITVQIDFVVGLCKNSI